MKKKRLNSAAVVQEQAANNESTEKGTMSNVQVETDGKKETQDIFELLMREIRSEKLGFERSTKERLSVEDYGLMEVTRRIGDNILFNVHKAIDFDEEKQEFKFNATEGKVELEVDDCFVDEIAGYYNRKMFISAMDAYLHTQATCGILIDNLLHKSLIIHFEGCDKCGHTDKGNPIFKIIFSWKIIDYEGKEKLVDSAKKKYVSD